MSEAARPSEPDPSWHGVEPTGERSQDPFPALHHLREVAPVNETPMGFWRLSRYRDCVRLLREVRCGVRHLDGTQRDGQEQVGSGEFMLSQDPPTHTRLRKLVSKAFTPRAAERWRPRAGQIVDELLAPCLEAGEMDVIADLALPVPSTLICEMLGVPVADRSRFTGWTADATHALAGRNIPPENLQRAQEAGLQLGIYFDALIAERRKDLRDDLLSVMIRAEEEGERLSAEELIVQSIGLLIAGFETTIGLIGLGVANLAEHPDQMQVLRQRPELTANAVEECLRYEGPIPLTLRILHEDAEFGGRVIPKDTEVHAYLMSANRDPERFPDPDRFWVERPNAKEHLAFGGGTHHCLGMHLARMEAQVAIGTLVARTREIQRTTRDIEWGPSLFRVPGRLPVKLHPA